MSGLTFSTPILAWVALPWSVMTSQSMPCRAPWRTWSTTRYLPSLLYWVWTVVVAREPQEALRPPAAVASRRSPWRRGLDCGVSTVAAARPAPSSPARRSSHRRDCCSGVRAVGDGGVEGGGQGLHPGGAVVVRVAVTVVVMVVPVAVFGPLKTLLVTARRTRAPRPIRAQR
ncbi:hypothetical protein SGLAM104S_04722 [Streptomyces glaucescens]